MADDLRELLDIAKRDLPDVPDEVWKRFERVIRGNFGATRIYIASQKKGRNLALLESAGTDDTAKIAELLGVSIRQARSYKKLR